jgi:hypothetical protein
MSESPRSAVRRWIFTVVDELGTDAVRQRVHARIQQLYLAEFTAQDLVPRIGRSGELAWQNNVDSLYDELKHAGEMLPSERGDPWRLSPASTSAASLYGSELEAEVESNFFADFKPKDASEYVAHTQGQVLHKRRDHELTLELFGRAIARAGWRPATNVHPRDLELTRRDIVCLVEVKQMYRGNATKAVREAIAQLLEYRYYWYRSATVMPLMLAVFSESIGAEHSRYLDSLEIASVWRSSGSSWDGNVSAGEFGLVPE